MIKTSKYNNIWHTKSTGRVSIFLENNAIILNLDESFYFNKNMDLILLQMVGLGIGGSSLGLTTVNVKA